MKFYVTFPFQDEENRNKFSIVYAEDQAQARQLTHDEYGTYWAFMYSEEKFAGQEEAYGLTVRHVLGVPE